MRRVACELYHIDKRCKSDIGSGAHVVYLTVAYVRYVRFAYPKMSVVGVRLISIKKVEKGSQTRKEFKMNSVINKVCKHTANELAISIVNDMKYSFCENCEQNIYSHYIEDNDLMSYWSSWKVGK